MLREEHFMYYQRNDSGPQFQKLCVAGLQSNKQETVPKKKIYFKKH